MVHSIMVIIFMEKSMVVVDLLLVQVTIMRVIGLKVGKMEGVCSMISIQMN